jgi:asparagine synthase (glutamine-hydrolysing)
MCGIAGILWLDGRPADTAPVERMCRVLAHRGPDDEGVTADGPMALGHRRLAIIDLSAAGHQPMHDAERGTWISYNGEIYNFADLRAEYEAGGDTFRSHSDTEVVLRAYAHHGADCVHRFNGMFAFAVWDSPARRLVLARDKFGIKPIYYLREDNRLIFASEIKAILAVTDRPRRVSADALNEYFTFQNIYSDLTLFEGIRLLPAGHMLTVENGDVSSRPFWNLVFDPDDVDESVHAARLRDALEGEIQRQLVSDVPVGAYLSGGMDSASIVSVASRCMRRLATFTGGFDLSHVFGDERGFDERADAERVASMWATEHYEMVLHPRSIEALLPRLVWHLEDLRTGSSYQNFSIANLASRFVKVVLAGVGGDEIFAGYPWRYSTIADEWNACEFERKYYEQWSRLIPDAEKSCFFTSEMRRAADPRGPFEQCRRILGPTRGWHPVDRAMYFDAKTFLHGLLVVEDKLSMAYGLETRLPFLGDEVIEVAARIPASLKLVGSQGKVIVRTAMAGRLPSQILDKVKQGFSPPDQSWYHGPMADYARSVLLDPRTLDRGYFEPQYIRTVVESHLAGRTNARRLLWSLLCFEWWHRLFIDGEPLPDAA